MSKAKVVFITGLHEKIVEIVADHNPDGFETQVVYRDTPLEDQKAAVADADFLLVYGAPLHDDVLKAAPKARMVQLLAAGYDSMNLELLREMEIPCCNNGGANSRAVADQALFLMLSLYKQGIAAHASTTTGDWNGPNTAERSRLPTTDWVCSSWASPATRCSNRPSTKR